MTAGFQHLTDQCGHHCVYIVTPTMQEKESEGIERHCPCPECHGSLR